MARTTSAKDESPATSESLPPPQFTMTRKLPGEPFDVSDEENYRRGVIERLDYLSNAIYHLVRRMDGADQES